MTSVEYPSSKLSDVAAHGESCRLDVSIEPTRRWPPVIHPEPGSNEKKNREPSRSLLIKPDKEERGIFIKIL